MDKKKLHTIFNPGRCLTQKEIFGYRKNALSDEEANYVERHTLECVMCREALGGLEEKENLDKKFIEFKQKFQSKVDYQNIDEVQAPSRIVASHSNPKKGLNPIFKYVAGVAAIFVVVFLINDFDKESSNDSIAENDYLSSPVENSYDIPVDSGTPIPDVESMFPEPDVESNDEQVKSPTPIEPNNNSSDVYVSDQINKTDKSITFEELLNSRPTTKTLVQNNTTEEGFKNRVKQQLGREVFMKGDIKKMASKSGKNYKPKYNMPNGYGVFYKDSIDTIPTAEGMFYKGELITGYKNYVSDNMLVSRILYVNKIKEDEEFYYFDVAKAYFEKEDYESVPFFTKRKRFLGEDYFLAQLLCAKSYLHLSDTLKAKECLNEALKGSADEKAVAQKLFDAIK